MGILLTVTVGEKNLVISMRGCERGVGRFGAIWEGERREV